MASKLTKLVILAAPIMLAACGEGYEMTRVEGIVPYTQDRTAGTGVAYVRAKMLPAKEVKIESATPAPAVVTAPPPPPPAAAEKPIEEKVFREKQSK